MDKSNRITKKPMEQIKEVVDYIIDNAPPEALREFSKQFLTESFQGDPDKFQEHYKVYSEYMDDSNPGYGQLLHFSKYLRR